MIKIKIAKDKRGLPNLKLKFENLEDREEKLLKRVILDSKKIEGQFKYETPLKYLFPIMNIFSSDKIKVDGKSKLTFFEFSDSYDEKYYYTYEINPSYMKKWRAEGCPNIFKIQINEKSNTISKEIIFKKINNKE